MGFRRLRRDDHRVSCRRRGSLPLCLRLAAALSGSFRRFCCLFLSCLRLCLRRRLLFLCDSYRTAGNSQQIIGRIKLPVKRRLNLVASLSHSRDIQTQVLSRKLQAVKFFLKRTDPDCDRSRVCPIAVGTVRPNITGSADADRIFPFLQLLHRKCHRDLGTVLPSQGNSLRQIIIQINSLHDICPRAGNIKLFLRDRDRI